MKSQSEVYLENCIQRKSIDDKKYLINQDIRGNVIKNINDDSIESFEENEVKQLAYCQHMQRYACVEEDPFPWIRIVWLC